MITMLIFMSATVNYCTKTNVETKRNPSTKKVLVDSDTLIDKYENITNPQSALLITFDFHWDPYTAINHIPSNELRKKKYEARFAASKWLMDNIADKYGAKISFLSSGEPFEMCLHEKYRQDCFELMRRFYKSGNMISSHSHAEVFKSSYNWTPLNEWNTTESESSQVWDDVNYFARQVISQALGVTNPDQITAINTANMSHVPSTQVETKALNKKLEDYGYTIKEGGGNDQTLIPLFGHTPFSIYKPGDDCQLCEDLNKKFVVIPQGPPIGLISDHFGFKAFNGTAERKKVEILQALVNRRLFSLNPDKGARVWSYGWGLHGFQLVENYQDDACRSGLQDLIPWIDQQKSDRDIMKFASYVEARDQYKEWETANPETSSFNYPEAELQETNYDYYPYAEWANKFLKEALYSKQIDNDKIDAFLLKVNDMNLVLAYLKEDQTKAISFDLSNYFNDTITKVMVDSGDSIDIEDQTIKVGLTPVIVVESSEKQSILEYVSEMGYQ